MARRTKDLNYIEVSVILRYFLLKDETEKVKIKRSVMEVMELEKSERILAVSLSVRKTLH